MGGRRLSDGDAGVTKFIRFSKSSGSLPSAVGPCAGCIKGRATLGETVTEQYRLLPLMAFLSRKNHRNHFCRLLPWTQDSHQREGGSTASPPVDLALQIRRGWIWHPRSPKAEKSLRASCSAGKLYINTLTHVKTRPRSYCQDQYILG